MISYKKKTVFKSYNIIKRFHYTHNYGKINESKKDYIIMFIHNYRSKYNVFIQLLIFWLNVICKNVNIIYQKERMYNGLFVWISRKWHEEGRLQVQYWFRAGFRLLDRRLSKSHNKTDKNIVILIFFQLYKKNEKKFWSSNVDATS